MIAKSDLVILVVSSAALAVGVLRWQSNVSAPRIASAPAAGISSPVSSDVPRIVADVARTDERTVSGNVSRSTGGTSVRRITPDPLPSDAGSSSVAAVDATDDARVAEERLDTATMGDADSVNVNEPLYGIYEVQEGDYLSRIAEQHGTSVANLQAINELDSDVILIGQELRYPLPAN